MRSFHDKKLPALLCAYLIIILSPSRGWAQDSGSRQLYVGGEYLSLGTHFAEYSGGTLNAWESFGLFGGSAEMMWHLKDTDRFSLYGGVGASVLLGGYDFEVGISTGSGTTFPALGIRAFAEIDYPLESGLVLLGQAGVSLWYLSSAATEDDAGSYFPYEERFDEGVGGVLLGVGVRPTERIRVLLRFQLFSLGAWTDYSIQGGFPEEVGTSYFSLGLSWLLGG